MTITSKRNFLKSLVVTLSIVASSLIFSPLGAAAEVVEVEGQGDCPGGNDGWQRHLIVDVGSSPSRTYTRCVRIEQVPVDPSPDSSATTDRPAQETVSRVAGATDPYPNIPTGGEIPGTRVVSTDETSWPQFFNNTVAASWRCPVAYGPNGDPYAAENNGFDSVSGKWFRVCVKNPWREPIPQSVSNSYESEKSEAISEALRKSQNWNSRNPGMQKCFQWGPLTSPSGGTESGGVCANPVGVSSDTSQTVDREGRLVALAEISSTKKRTTASLDVLKALTLEERANALNASLGSRKQVVNINLIVPGIRFVVVARSEDAKSRKFRGTKDAEGEAEIKTRKLLPGDTLTLSVRKLKIGLQVID
jgi:hypothetical protein